MIEIDATVERREGVTLVAATLYNDRSTAQRVRLRSTLAGPVWPPRSGGVPTPAWTDRRWTGVLDPGERRGVGFASPARPIDPPVELLGVSRARFDGSDAMGADAAIREVLSTLEPSRPDRRTLEGGEP